MPQTPEEQLAALRQICDDQLSGEMPEADARFIDCLLAAVLAALPVFLEALMKCIAGGGASDYCPGDRDRC